jgi:hypothetical protein
MHSIKWYFSIKHLKLQHTENEIIQKKVKDIILSILALTFNVSQLSGYTSKTFSKFESALLKSPNLICTCPKPGNRIKKLKQWNRQIIPSLWKCHWDAINIILMQPKVIVACKIHDQCCQTQDPTKDICCEL